MKRILVGMVCELLTIRDPYEAADRLANRVEAKVIGSYKKPNHTWSGKQVGGTHVVWQIQANSSDEAMQFLKGTTIEGARSRSLVRVGPNLWDVDIFEWDTSGLSGDDAPSQSMSIHPCAVLVLLALTPFLCFVLWKLIYWVEHNPDLVLRFGGG